MAIKVQKVDKVVTKVYSICKPHRYSEEEALKQTKEVLENWMVELVALGVECTLRAEMDITISEATGRPNPQDQKEGP